MTGRGADLATRANDFLTPLALGALATFGFAPFGYYGLTLLALVGLLALWWDSGWRRAAWRGWFFGLGQFLAGLYWVIISTHQFGGVPLIAGLFLLTLLSAVLALFPAVAGALAGLMRGLPRGLWALIFVPSAWLFAELARATVGTGFPWFSTGYALTAAPITDLAPLVGVYGLGALMMVASGTLVLLFRGRIAARATSVALIIALPFAIWWLPAAESWTQPTGKPLSVAVLQGNVPQDQKWREEALARTKAKYRRLSESVDARLVVWPEAAVASLLARERAFMRAVDKRAEKLGRTELVGILDYEREEDAFYNAMFALGVDQGRYYKRHLVPFGEYFPVPDFIRPLLDGVNMRFSSFAHGPEQQAPIEVADVPLSLSICFEVVFPREIRKALPEAGILVNVTNDAWFADSTAPHQHLQIARMRAMESGRPLVRAANTGISAIIAPDGRIRKRVPQFEVTTLAASVQPRAGATPYVRYGDAPLWALSIALCALGMIGSRLRGRHAD